MGVWDAISNGEMPTLDDVVESGNNTMNTVGDGLSTVGEGIVSGAEYVGEGVHAVGETITDGAEYVADGAVELGHTAVGYGERAIDTVAETGDAVYHRLTDWHFEDRDAANTVDPSEAAHMPTTEGVPDANGWTLQPELYARLHQDEDVAGTETKYVNADGREYIAHTDGSEVTRGDIMGTYNYVNPGIWSGDLENQADVELGDNMVANAAESLVSGASDLTGLPVGGALEMAGRFVGHTGADVLPWIAAGSVREGHEDDEREGGVIDRLRILTGL